MRIISNDLKTAQELNTRFPISKVEVYDSLLRWGEILHSAAEPYAGADYSISGFDTYDGVPAAFSDAEVHNDMLYHVAVRDGNRSSLYYDLSDETVKGYIEESAYMDPCRVSCVGDVFFLTSYANYIYDVRLSVIGPRVIDSFGYASSGEAHAIAAVSTTEVYHAYLNNGIVGLEYCTQWMSTRDEMNYGIPVPDDYNTGSLSWFDAVRLPDGTDVIVVNTETYGKPEVILRQNGVWSDRAPLIPVDVVDNYSYLRIGWMKVYDGVIYATGELGRKGSSGKHPQSMAVVLRSKDGIHWTLDRWRYLGQTPFRSPLLMRDGYAYRTHAPYVYQAPLTPLFGLDVADATDDHVCFTIDEDIVAWNAQMAGDMGVGTMKLTLNDAQQQFSSPSSPTYIKPGYMLKVYAGYKTEGGDQYAQVGWYGVDTIPKSTAASNSNLVIACREWNMRALNDNRFDQDWQWLSQTRHYDDCNQRDYLYSIGEGTVRLVDEDGNDTVVTGEPANPENGRLKVFTRPGRTTLVSTTPFEMQDGFVSTMFMVDGWYSGLTWTPGLYNHGLSYNPTTQRIGTGAGPAIIEDENNLLTVFLDVKTRYLVLLRISKDGEEEVWTEIDKHRLDWETYVFDPAIYGDRYYEVWMDVQGTTVKYGLAATEWTTYTLAEPDVQDEAGPNGFNSNPYVTRDFVEFEMTGVVRKGENRAGIVVGTSSPTTRIIINRDHYQNMCGRHLSEYNHGEDIENEPYYVETGDYTWQELFDTIVYFAEPETGEQCGGYMYVNGERGICHSPGGSYGPPQASDRGDWISGRWPIAAVDSTLWDTNTDEMPYASYVYIELNPNAAYPPGESGSYWLSTSDSFTDYGFLFVSGDLENEWYALDGSQIEDAGNGNIRFAVTIGAKNDHKPAAGDRIIFTPGLEWGRLAEQYRDQIAGSKIYWYDDPPGVTLQSFIAYDREKEKSIRWALEDIAAKAGVLDCLPGVSGVQAEFKINQLFFGSGYNFLSDQAGDFDLHVYLSGAIGADHTLTLYFGCGRAYTTGSPPTDSDDRVELTIDNDAANPQITITSYVGGDSVPHLVRKLDAADLGEAFRFVKHDAFISVWSEHRLLVSYPIRHILPEYPHSEDLVESGYVGFKTSQALSYTVQQEDLWSRADGIIADQGMNALQAMRRVIRDARIKVLADEALALRVSAFENRDDLGQAVDVIFADESHLTDAIPTHIRVVGEEIGEYFDHDTAAEYGVTFQSENVESLGEEEAFLEALKIIHDALGKSEGRTNRIAGQLQYEPEDQIDVIFETVDGQQVNQTCVIDTASLQYSRANLEMTITLRKKYA